MISITLTGQDAIDYIERSNPKPLVAKEVAGKVFGHSSAIMEKAKKMSEELDKGVLVQYPVEDKVVELIKESVDKEGSRNTVSYLVSRSARSESSVRKTIKMLGYKTKGGYIVSN